MQNTTRSVETLSEHYDGTVQINEHYVVEESQIVPGPDPEPHLRYEGQTSYLERFYRCVACDLDVLRIRDFPATCDAPLFAPGDVVIDEQNPHGEAIVIDPDCGPANVVRIDEDKTVAEYPGNEGYPPDDKVTRIYFLDSLDAYVPGWREWNPNELGSALKQYSDVRSYGYPESRLKLSDGDAKEQSSDRQPVSAGGTP